ncbi:autoinducer binding domain-containing protein [Bradyrhizobium yuanmingense]|uniref:autoinducer binding domain-containing protein n=1 Tax=Bradyrhizobium yuanmingense TaxID=108015 RepID=UPI0023B8CFC7|nr:autoinducer binding domain-containing protein [Bradyrhizobium yuanmingense]MDF0584974.1 autoinducer binding domain-containing protein [Bradyrhizobium yuanmingense]
MDWSLAPPETSAIEHYDREIDRPTEAPIMNPFSFTECANQSHLLRALFELLVRCATKEGFSEVAYGALNFVDPLRLPEFLLPTVAVKWPPNWCDRYFKRNYHIIDPVVRRTPMLSRPFCGTNSPTSINFNQTKDA